MADRIAAARVAPEDFISDPIITEIVQEANIEVIELSEAGATFQLNLSRFCHSPYALNASTPTTPPPLTLPKHPLNTPCPTKSAHVELKGRRV